MRVTDLPSLTPFQYGDAGELKAELTAFVNYIQLHPTRNDLVDWFEAAVAFITTKIGTGSAP